MTKKDAIKIISLFYTSYIIMAKEDQRVLIDLEYISKGQSINLNKLLQILDINLTEDFIKASVEELKEDMKHVPSNKNSLIII